MYFLKYDGGSIGHSKLVMNRATKDEGGEKRGISR